MTAKEEIKQKIMERGYWEIVLRPTQPTEQKFTFQQLRDLLEKHQVKFRGWYYPHLSQSTKFGDYHNVQGYVEGYVHWNEYADTFRFYQSGQFIQYLGMPEDRFEDIAPMFVEWDPAMQKPPPAQPFLEPIMTVYQLTEIFLFASRLASDGVFGKQVQILIKLHNMNHRILKTLDRMRVPFHDHECHTDVIELGPVIITPEKLEKEHDKLAIDNTIKILELFNFTSEHIKKVLEDDQKKFYARTF